MKQTKWNNTKWNNMKQNMKWNNRKQNSKTQQKVDQFLKIIYQLIKVIFQTDL